MRLQHSSARSFLTAGLIGCIIGALLGALGMQILQPTSSRAAPPGTRAPASGESRRLTELASVVESMGASIERLRAELTLRPGSPPSAEPASEPAPADEGGGREAIVTSDVAEPAVELIEVLEILQELEAIADQIGEVQEIQLLIVELLQRVPEAVGLAAASTRLPPIPLGTTVRSYMAALKSGDFETASAHSLWGTERVIERYGRPDEIVNHGDYEEWIYWLDEENEQFDFHFINGLCVQAH
jgi:hypothetical protein